MSSILVYTKKSDGNYYDYTNLVTVGGFGEWVDYESGNLDATFWVQFFEDSATRAVLRIGSSTMCNDSSTDRWVRIFRPDGSQAAQGKVAKNGGTKDNDFTNSAWSPVWTKTHSTFSQDVSWKVIWYSDSGYSKVYKTWTFHATGTITPKPSYTVYYSANGGKSTPSAQTKWYGEALTLASAIARSPYTLTFNGNSGSTPSAASIPWAFASWKYSANNTSYAGGGSLPAGVNAGGTMTAQWTRSTSTVTLATSVRQNYAFNGWYTAASGGTRVGGSGGSYTLNASATVYAQWTQVYATPRLSISKWYRCDKDGIADDEGSHVRVECEFDLWNTTDEIEGVAQPNSVLQLNCRVGDVTQTATAVQTANASFNQYSEDLDISGNLLSGSCTFLVSEPYSGFALDQRYDVVVTLMDVRGALPSDVQTRTISGAVVSTGLAQRKAVLASAAYPIDVLGSSQYLYNKTDDYQIDSSKTYYRKLDGSYVESDPSDYPNLAKTTPRVWDPPSYLALQIALDEWLEADQEYVLQLWDVNVSHSAKGTSDLGVGVYYCGGSVRLGGWYGSSNFTNGHADHLTMTFTPRASSGATTSTSGQHTYSGGDNSLAHSSVSSAQLPFISLYNSVPSVSGTMSLTVGSWTLEKTGTGSWSALSSWEPSFLDAEGVEDGYINLLVDDEKKPAKWTIRVPARTKITNQAKEHLGQRNEYETVIAFPTTAEGYEIVSSPGIRVVPNTSYTLSFDYSTNKAFENGTYTGNPQFGVEICSAAPTSGITADSGTVFGHEYFLTEPTAGILRRSITFTPTTSTIYIVLNGGYLADGQTDLSFWFGHLVLEKTSVASGLWFDPVDVYEANGPRPGHGIAFGGVSKKEAFEVFGQYVNHVAPNGKPSSIPGQGLPWTALTSDLHFDSAGFQTGYSEFAIDSNDTFYRSFAIRRQMSIAESDTSTAALYLGVRSDGSTFFNTNAHMKVLWSGAQYMLANQTVNLNLGVTDQFSGIVLAWSAYVSGAAQNYDWAYTYIPKEHVVRHASTGVVTVMATTKFGYVGQKYVYVGNNTITGNASNTSSGTANGITYNSSYWVLRYVYGV